MICHKIPFISMCITFKICVTFVNKFVNGFDEYSLGHENEKIIFHNNHIWNLSDIHEWFWCVLSGDENKKMIFHKRQIWNLFDLHEWSIKDLKKYKCDELQLLWQKFHQII